jgi:hypothetical protein
LGLGGGEPIRLAGSAKDSKPNREQEKVLISTARLLKTPFEKDLTAEKVTADFLKKNGAAKEPE